MKIETPDEKQIEEIGVARATLTEEEFCHAVGISTRTAKRLRKKRKLPHCKIGRRVLYKPEHITEFLKVAEKKAA